MANNLNLTPELLDAYVGKPITDLCPLGFGTIGDEHNHCAHFVGHALTLTGKANVGKTCAVMTWDGRTRPEEGVCILVNDLFNRQTQLTEADEKGCLIYITRPGNVTTTKDGVTTMETNKTKHVGIYLGGCVWHYGNTKDKVKRQTLAEFEQHYSGKTVILYTEFPKIAAFVAYSFRGKPAPKKKK
jgi:hypothetical protein